MNDRLSFILVDDVAVNNQLVGRIVQRVLPGASVQQFTDPRQTLAFFADMDLSGAGAGSIVLLLDIYMPRLDAWSFLEEWDAMSSDVKAAVQVWLLSSSISPDDMKRAARHDLVAGCIQKPFTVESVQTIIQGPQW